MSLAAPANAQLIGPPVAGTGATGPTGPTGPAGPAPTGNAPQIVGYSAANTVEAETLSGGTLSRTGANAYLLSGITAAAGGVGTTYGAPACGSGGTIANGGTVTPDFTGTNCYTFTVASGASFTEANPTNLPTNAIVYITFNQAGTGSPTITWGNAYYQYSTVTNAYALSSSLSNSSSFVNATTGTATQTWWSDGTHLSLVPGNNVVGLFNSLKTQAFVVVGSNLTIGSDNSTTSMARMPMAFSVNQQTALVANEHMGTFKTTKAITIENVVLDPENITCAVSATITCFDCGASAGACTSAQTSTIYTSGSIATGSGGTSVDGTVTTANVAAAHYITCEVTAGTCATFQANVSLMARPQ